MQKDEELTVAYGYDHKEAGGDGPEAPDWYKLELEAFQQRQAPPTAWLQLTWRNQTPPQPALRSYCYSVSYDSTP